MKRVKGKTTIPLMEGRPAKPAAPSSSRRARHVEPHIVVSAERGPRKTDMMPEAPSGAGSDRMKPPIPAEATKRPRGKPKRLDLGDQRPIQQGGLSMSERGEQYIRMRIRVDEGKLTVLDSHLVDGPLSQTNVFSGGHTYDVSLDHQLLHAGHLPDLGVRRSFINPNPNAPREQKAHHVTEQEAYEFMARMPAAEVTRDTIGRITVRLHRVKEAARTDRLGAASLGEQFVRELRPVAEIVGLPESVLPEEIERRGGRTPRI